MPTVETQISDLESLLGRKLDRAGLETLLELVKGEVKEFAPEQDTAKLELNDSNRPDLWSPEGIVRQVRLSESKKNYPFFHSDEKVERKIIVSKEVKSVRPYIAACAARGLTVTQPILEQLIQSQEKLAEIFGRKRQTVSIGLYRLAKITFPVRYDLAAPEMTRFIPLGFDQPMTLAEIVARHPKGIAYAGALRGAERYPILIDAKNEILSFPPIINSKAIGEVQVGDSELLVEVTGTDLRMTLLALNIFACNLFDRGAAIEPVEIDFPEATEFGAALRTPLDFSSAVAVDLKEFDRVLGEKISREEAERFLTAYGYRIEGGDHQLQATAPPYRDDTMGGIDVIEDFVIARGIKSFEAEMPATFTIGGLTPLERFSDRLRDEMIGFGFQEIVSNILSSRQDCVERMRIEKLDQVRPEGRVIEIENPMTERFALLRPWLLPSLLRVEGVSSKAFYPHRIFEVGEVARFERRGSSTPEEASPETCVQLAGLISHPAANFSELHAVLEAICYSLGIRYRLESISHPTFIEGRSGRIISGEKEVGLIGEIDPEVLTRWQIGMPSVGFEIGVEILLASERYD